MILAGAGSVQVVSTLYRNQIEVIGKMVADIEKWMDAGGYENIESFRGKLSRNVTGKKLPYQRAQYIDLMMNASEILNKYRVIN
jgi:dihydroorotate dehydrogenase (fumarate)